MHARPWSAVGIWLLVASHAYWSAIAMAGRNFQLGPYGVLGIVVILALALGGLGWRRAIVGRGSGLLAFGFGLAFAATLPGLVPALGHEPFLYDAASLLEAVGLAWAAWRALTWGAAEFDASAAAGIRGAVILIALSALVWLVTNFQESDLRWAPGSLLGIAGGLVFAAGLADRAWADTRKAQASARDT